MPDGFPATPILDQLLREARTGGIRAPRHCVDELSGNPGEVHTCSGDHEPGGDHRSQDGHLTW